jgi:hypothetical protein
MIAFYGSAVAKYQYLPEAVTEAEAELAQAKLQADAAETEVRKAQEAADAAAPEQKPQLLQAVAGADAARKSAQAAVAAADKNLKAATEKAKPKDIVDIIVSAPVHIRVLPPEEAAKP